MFMRNCLSRVARKLWVWTLGLGLIPALAMPSLASEITLRLPASDTARLSFQVTDDRDAELLLDELSVSVSLGDNTTLLLDELIPFQDQIQVRLADYNFDGSLDVGILESEGYGGVNLFFAVFVFEPTSDSFVYWFTESNITLDAEAQEIHTHQRSGPRHYSTVYRLHQGQPYAYQTASPLLDWDLEKHSRYDPDGQLLDTWVVDLRNNQMPAERAITAEQAYFHQEPDEATQLSSYIITGDTVEILDSAGDWDDWLLVRYRGGKVFEHWIKAETIATPPS